MKIWLHIVLLLAILCSACPAYDDTYTGTYREVVSNEGPLPFPGERVAIDLFRFGDFTQAIVRYFEYGDAQQRTQGDPFAQESRCIWTETRAFDEDERTFDLGILAPTRRGRLSGRFNDDGSLEARLTRLDGSEGDLTLELHTKDPPMKCATVPDEFMTADFDHPENEFKSSYRLTAPVFAMAWVTVEPIESGGVINFVPNNSPPEPFFFLDDKHRVEDRGITGTLSLRISPPDPKIRTASGNTSFAIGHFVVIDDDGTDGRDDFDWSVSNEPIVATSLTGGTIPGVSPEDTNGFGRAILFVSDRLEDLSTGMTDSRGPLKVKREVKRNGVVEAEYVQIKDSSIDKEQHFYVVDVYFKNQIIKRVDIVDTSYELDVTITEDYLGDDTIRLPRLFPSLDP